MATRTPKTADLKKSNGNASTAVAVRPARNVVSIQDSLKAMVAGMGERIMPATGNRIKVGQNKQFTLPDGTVTDGPLQLVIVDFVTVHAFYPGKFDPKNITSPVCYAVGQNPKQMFPLKSSPDLQADDCQSCPMNQWGSDGDGKACKNSRRLAVLPPDATEDTPLWLLDVSPTALKGFDGYVAAVVRTFGVPPMGVVTTVGFSDAVDYARLTFSDPRPAGDVVAVAHARLAEAKELLMAEPDFSRVAAPAPARGKAPLRAGARR